MDKELVQRARARRSACISSRDSRLQALQRYNELLSAREPGPSTTRMVLERAWLQTFLEDHDAALADLDSVVLQRLVLQHRKNKRVLVFERLLSIVLGVQSS